MQSIHSCARNRRISKTLEALESLTPPSPELIPTSSRFSTSISGYIPIFLDVSNTDSSDNSIVADELTLDCKSFPASLSAGSVGTMGTFGPLNKTDENMDQSSIFQRRARRGFSGYSSVYSHDEPPSPRLASPLGSFRSIASLSPNSLLQPPTSTGYYDQASKIDTGSRFTISAYLESPLVSSNNLKPHSSMSDLSSPRIEIEAEEQVLLYRTPCQTFSTLPSPSFTHPSPSPSMDTINSARLSPRVVPRSHLVDTTRRPEDVPYPTRVDAPSTPVVPTTPITRRSLSNSSRTSASLRSCVLVPSLSSLRPSFLPGRLAWLEETVVGFFIDQEGFRSIQPIFKLVGYSHGKTGDGGSKMGATETVDFMPFKRESFVFHHAALDSTPILRRMTLNGDDTRDYISRQASLSLKTNGVYTVHGSESSALAQNTHHDSVNAPVKLEWKLAYLVDDRRAETTGRIIPGEKTLTPLTFSCAPGLLHPLQSKRVGFMHVVRKSVAPKLVAEKLEPPRLQHSRLTKRPEANPPPIPDEQSHLWMHRRAQSHVPGHNDANAERTQFTQLVQNAAQPSTAEPQRIRRRRASSAGERGRNGIPDVSRGSTRYIIPRAELCSLMENWTPPQPQSSFRPLNPPPRSATPF